MSDGNVYKGNRSWREEVTLANGYRIAMDLTALGEQRLIVARVSRYNCDEGHLRFQSAQEGRDAIGALASMIGRASEAIPDD